MSRHRIRVKKLRDPDSTARHEVVLTLSREMDTDTDYSVYSCISSTINAEEELTTKDTFNAVPSMCVVVGEGDRALFCRCLSQQIHTKRHVLSRVFI